MTKMPEKSALIKAVAFKGLVGLLELYLANLGLFYYSYALYVFYYMFVYVFDVPCSGGPVGTFLDIWSIGQLQVMHDPKNEAADFFHVPLGYLRVNLEMGVYFALAALVLLSVTSLHRKFTRKLLLVASMCLLLRTYSCYHSYLFAEAAGILIYVTLAYRHYCVEYRPDDNRWNLGHWNYVEQLFIARFGWVLLVHPLVWLLIVPELYLIYRIHARDKD